MRRISLFTPVNNDWCNDEHPRKLTGPTHLFAPEVREEMMRRGAVYTSHSEMNNYQPEEVDLDQHITRERES